MVIDDDTNLHDRNAWRPRFSDAFDVGREFGITYLLTGRRGFNRVTWQRRMIIGGVEWILQQLDIGVLQCSEGLSILSVSATEYRRSNKPASDRSLASH